jgi:hypothetical protein
MPVILQGISFMVHKPARFFYRGRLLNLFFGSSQTDHWLSNHGHFKFGVLGCFPSEFTSSLHMIEKACKLCANSVQTLKKKMLSKLCELYFCNGVSIGQTLCKPGMIFVVLPQRF